MGRHYLRLACRHVWRQKLYALINIVGLALGMMSCMLVLLLVENQLRYDRFHVHAQHIYHVVTRFTNPSTGREGRVEISPYRLSTALRQAFPEISQTVRVQARNVFLSRGNTHHYERRFAWVDPNIFEVFTLPLLQGDPHTALQRPFSLVLTPAMARKYFGDANPLGERLTLSTWDFGQQNPIDKQLPVEATYDFTVTGILQPIPRYSHLQFSFLASLNGAEPFFSPISRRTWGLMTVQTFVLLPAHVDPKALEPRLHTFIAEHRGHASALRISLSLQPFTAIRFDVEDRKRVMQISPLAIFVLLMACVSFINLAMARASTRAQEVALRKVLGASRQQLITQFLGEAIVVACLALPLALVGCELLLAMFNAMPGHEEIVTFRYLQHLPLFGGLLIAGVGVGIVAGSYPAFFLSGYLPMAVFRGMSTGGTAIVRWRKILLLIQCTCAIAFLVGAGVVHQQLTYLHRVNMGYEMQRVVIIPRAWLAHPRYAELKQAWLQLPHVTAVALGLNHPLSTTNLFLKTRPEGIENGAPEMQMAWVDHDFFNVLGIPMVAGRNFSSTDTSTTPFILNEAAVRALDWAEPVGKRFAGRYIQDGQWHWGQGTVIGVVQDTYYKPLDRAIEPTVFMLMPHMTSEILIRIAPADIQATLLLLRQTWQRFFPERPFEAFTLQDLLNEEYEGEAALRLGIAIGALFALMIACLGLFGLTAFVAEQRTKELGIRKVLGASVVDMVVLLVRDFTPPVLVAICFAWPLAYIVMQRWLTMYAYHIELGPGPFLFAGGLTLLLAWATVGWQAMKAARIRPVDALRYE